MKKERPAAADKKKPVAGGESGGTKKAGKGKAG